MSSSTASPHGASREVGIHRDGLVLQGTLQLPAGDGPFDAVLMLAGSGPLDRNENIRGQALNVFNTFANALADAGFASLRYDKRGCGRSGGDYYAAGHHDLVQDALACTEALQNQSLAPVNRVYLLGHSEGTVMVPQVFAQRPVDGAVLLCPFVESMASVLARQARQIEGEIAPPDRPFRGLRALVARLLGADAHSQRALIRRVQATRADTIRVRMRRVPARWLRELLDLDFGALFAGLACPVLLIGGAKDLQCQPGDVALIAERAPGPVEAHVIPDLTHLLRREPGTPGMLKSRKLLNQPVDREVVRRVVDWLRRQI